MRDITFAVPCYNSEDYMERCINSLLPGGDRVEILVVDDGSTDATGEIADRYEKQFPGLVRAIHQKNGGHGAAVNTGLKYAEGSYFKVVDSDDWLDGAALERLLSQIDSWKRTSCEVDLIVCNYLYDHLYERRIRCMDYRGVFPEGRICGWKEIGRFAPSQYLVMHALIYRTEILKNAGLCLPEHTFYVDNIFANQPLPCVERICYLNLDLYHYFLGREDQSVNEKVLMSRIDQQIRVTEIVAGCTDLYEVKERYPKLANYLVRNISIMMAISSLHLLMIGTPEAMEKRERLWKGIRSRDRRLYRKLKYTTVSGLTYIPGRAGAGMSLAGYRAAQKLYQFN